MLDYTNLGEQGYNTENVFHYAGTAPRDGTPFIEIKYHTLNMCTQAVAEKSWWRDNEAKSTSTYSRRYSRLSELFIPFRDLYKCYHGLHVQTGVIIGKRICDSKSPQYFDLAKYLETPRHDLDGFPLVDR